MISLLLGSYFGKLYLDVLAKDQSRMLGLEVSVDSRRKMEVLLGYQKRMNQKKFVCQYNVTKQIVKGLVKGTFDDR